MHSSDMFCTILPNLVKIGYTVAEISQFFRVYLVKCKNSLNDLQDDRA